MAEAKIKLKVDGVGEITDYIQAERKKYEDAALVLWTELLRLLPNTSAVDCYTEHYRDELKILGILK